MAHNILSVGSVVLLVFAIVPAAHAMPDRRAVAEGLQAAIGGDGVPVEAIEIDGCERVAGQPGYLCSYSINPCTAGGLDSAHCDDPGIVERAIFVGGDNGWLAIGIGRVDGPAPAIPLDPSSPLMNEVTPEWLAGAWNPEGNCENDAGFALKPGGAYASNGATGRWETDGETLTITLTHQATGGEGTPLQRLPSPQILRWQVMRLGPHIGQLTYEDGSAGPIIRC